MCTLLQTSSYIRGSCISFETPSHPVHAVGRIAGGVRGQGWLEFLFSPWRGMLRMCNVRGKRPAIVFG